MVRFKNRYLLVSLVFPASLRNPLRTSTNDDDDDSQPPPPPNVNEGGLVHLLRDSLSVNFGDVGAGEVGGAFSSEFKLPRSRNGGVERGRQTDVSKKGRDSACG